MKRKYFSFGSPWEEEFGYTRLVKVGNMIFVSGTTAFNERGEIVGLNDMYEQTKQCYNNIAKALELANSTLGDIVRVRFFVTDSTLYRDVGRAHKEALGDTTPAATLVEIKSLLSPEMMIEIEVDAIVNSE